MIARFGIRFGMSMSWVAFAMSLAGLSACQHGASPEATELFGAPSEISNAMEASDAYPSDVARSTFVDFGKEGGEASEIIITIEPHEDDETKWSVRYRRGEGQSPFREDVLATTDDGVVMLETTDHERDALTVYDPPLTLMPTELAPGEPFTHNVAMLVHPVGDRDAVRRRGSGRQIVELIDSQSVRTEAGRVDALHVRSRFEAELAPARVESVTERWYAPGKSAVGFIAERSDETVYVFGVKSSTRGHLWVWRSDE